jgi:hypothetical protein
LKSERSTAARSFRAVYLAITLVSLIAFSSVAYSFYRDYQGFIGVLSMKGSTAVKETSVLNGNNVTLYVNATLPNKGLYPITLGVSCLPDNFTVLSCNSASVTIPPGQNATLHLRGTLLSSTPTQALETAKWRFSFGLATYAAIDIVVVLANVGGK